MLRRVFKNFLSTRSIYAVEECSGLPAPRVAGEYQVWDSGRGIPAEGAGIFEEFRRLKDSTMTRNVVWVLAWRLRTGSPACWTPVVAALVARTRRVFAITVPLGNCGGLIAASLHPDLADDRWPADAFCLENEPAVRNQALLVSWGCHTVALRDRESAMGWLQRREAVPDILLVDYHLDRGESGLELAEEMQRIWGRRVASIVITADHTQEAQTAAIARGCQILRKPVKPAALRAVMNSMRLRVHR